MCPAFFPPVTRTREGLFYLEEKFLFFPLEKPRTFGFFPVRSFFFSRPAGLSLFPLPPPLLPTIPSYCRAPSSFSVSEASLLFFPQQNGPGDRIAKPFFSRSPLPLFAVSPRSFFLVGAVSLLDRCFFLGGTQNGDLATFSPLPDLFIPDGAKFLLLEIFSSMGATFAPMLRAMGGFFFRVRPGLTSDSFSCTIILFLLRFRHACAFQNMCFFLVPCLVEAVVPEMGITSRWGQRGVMY